MTQSVFIVTRFNLKLWKKTKNNQPTLSDEWIRERMELFCTYCLPSIRVQTQQNFKWIILLADDTAVEYKQKILEISTEYKNLMPFYLKDVQTENYIEYISSLVYNMAKQENANRIVTIRLDNDDALHKSFVEKVCQADAAEQSDTATIYSFRTGLQYYVKNGMTLRFPWENNHFLALGQNISASNDYVNIFNFNHYHIQSFGFHFKCIDSGVPMWVEIIHDKNVANDIPIKSFYHNRLINNGIAHEGYGTGIVTSHKSIAYQFLFFYLPQLFNKVVHKVCGRG